MNKLNIFKQKLTLKEILGIFLSIALLIISIVIYISITSMSNIKKETKDTSPTLQVESFEKWSTYSSKKNNITFKYPSNWIITSNEQNAEIINIKAPSGELVTIKYNISTQSTPYYVYEEKDVNFFSTDYREVFYNEIKECKGLKESSDIDEKCLDTFNTIELNDIDPKRDIHDNQFYSTVKNTPIVFLFKTPYLTKFGDTNVNIYIDVFNKIINSLKS